MNTTRRFLHPTIDSAELLPGLEPEILNRLLVAGTLRRLDADTRIVEHGDSVSSFCVLLKGVIAFSHPIADGKAVTSELRKAPAFFHHAELLAGTRAASRITTLEETQVLEVPAAALVQALDASQHLLTLVMHESARHQDRLSFILRALALNQPEQRLAHLFLELVDAFGLPAEGGVLIRMPLTQETLADLLGMHRRSIIRAMQTWESERCVEKRGDRYVVTNQAALKRYAALSLT